MPPKAGSPKVSPKLGPKAAAPSIKGKGKARVLIKRTRPGSGPNAPSETAAPAKKATAAEKPSASQGSGVEKVAAEKSAFKRPLNLDPPPNSSAAGPAAAEKAASPAVLKQASNPEPASSSSAVIEPVRPKPHKALKSKTTVKNLPSSDPADDMRHLNRSPSPEMRLPPEQKAPPVMPPDAIRHLLERIDPNASIEDSAARLVSFMADQMLDDVVDKATKLAIHRGSKVLEEKDVALVLEEDWGIMAPAELAPMNPACR